MFNIGEPQRGNNNEFDGLAFKSERKDREDDAQKRVQIRIKRDPSSKA